MEEGGRKKGQACRKAALKMPQPQTLHTLPSLAPPTPYLTPTFPPSPSLFNLAPAGRRSLVNVAGNNPNVCAADRTRLSGGEGEGKETRVLGVHYTRTRNG